MRGAQNAPGGWLDGSAARMTTRPPGQPADRGLRGPRRVTVRGLAIPRRPGHPRATPRATL
ncbi:hypothetical protein PSMK_20660 [Phycisphaera mikurensis NBRC 102666]|uniref:Uncharacterized protein n=1 Tax=Phycisphaera mikurensis (strain NBRC 102666 / KCTC 22515 / FYK2301M01) TaxID=1142394 RepID=I0IG37_PHYMF|nr:hypothetical protein PSMK_20660 [Phycisphaera mikurensis NBRC 102666]